jgi:hypothetical protein
MLLIWSEKGLDEFKKKKEILPKRQNFAQNKKSSFLRNQNSNPVGSIGVAYRIFRFKPAQ